MEPYSADIEMLMSGWNTVYQARSGAENNKINPPAVPLKRPRFVRGTKIDPRNCIQNAAWARHFSMKIDLTKLSGDERFR
jgi:hypothetical protein